MARPEMMRWRPGPEGGRGSSPKDQRNMIPAVSPTKSGLRFNLEANPNTRSLLWREPPVLSDADSRFPLRPIRTDAELDKAMASSMS